MMQHRRCDVAAVERALEAALRHGLRASQLLEYGRPIVDLLVPQAEDVPDDNIAMRAVRTEDLIKRAIDRLDGRTRQALSILLGLSHDGIAPKLVARRKQAAHLLGINPNTFRVGKHEKDLLRTLALEIVKIIFADKALEDTRRAAR